MIKEINFLFHDVIISSSALKTGSSSLKRSRTFILKANKRRTHPAGGRLCEGVVAPRPPRGEAALTVERLRLHNNNNTTKTANVRLQQRWQLFLNVKFSL